MCQRIGEAGAPLLADGARVLTHCNAGALATAGIGTALAPVYVGQTAHDPEHRFEQHKAGGRLASGKPHHFGVRLRHDLMKGIGPFRSRHEAEAAERAVAEALERRGHRVFWG